MSASGCGATVSSVCVSLVALLIAGCQNTALLEIRSEPPGAQIMTQDRSYVGTTPCTVRLGFIPDSAYASAVWEPGKRYIANRNGYEPDEWYARLSLKGVAKGAGGTYKWSHVFVLKPKTRPSAWQPQQQQQQQQQQTVVVGDTGTSQSSRKGLVSVTSAQEDAEVYVDGIFSGNCPANLRLSEGIHIIEVRKPGFRNYRRELRVSADSELTLRAQLEQ